MEGLKPKVLHLSTAVDWRGGENQMALLYSGLKKKGIDQDVFLPTGKACLKLIAMGIRTRTLAFRNPWFLADALRISSIVRKEKFNIIHAHDAKAHSLAYISKKTFNCPGKLVVHRRVDNPIRNSKMTRLKYQHQELGAIICVSDHIADIVANYLGSDEAVHTIYSAVAPPVKNHSRSLHQLLDIPETTQLIGNVSALDAHKDPLTFLRVAEICLLKNDQLHFVWVGGDAGKMEFCKRWVENKKLGHRIHFTGYLDEAADLISCMDVFLFTSKSEGLGTTILDAMIRRVPVVATTSGGPSEIIQHGINGWLAPVGDAEKLAEGVFQFLLDSNEKHALLNAAREEMKTRFSPEIMTQKTLALYQNLLQDGVTKV